MLKKLLLSLLFLPSTLSFAFADLTMDLDGYYNLDSGATDSLGATNGTASGGIIFSSLYGKISGGAYFPTGSDYIDLGNTTFNYSGTDLTICAWVYPTLSSGTVGTVFSNYNSGGSKAQYQVKLYNNAGVTKAIYNIANTSEESYTGTQALTASSWNYLCSVYVRSTGLTVFYVNNVVDSTTHTFSQTPPASSFGNTSIGRAGSYNGVYFKGYIDEVYVASRALSGSEIDELYNGGTGLTYPFTTGGGSPTATSSIYSTSTVVIPATVYSSQFIQNPVSTSTYSFTSTVSSSTLKQSGVIFIVHSTSTTPTITWGGTAMTLLDTTATISDYRTSLFVIRNPTATSSVVISGISASSTKYISQSVWSNATAYGAFDKYNVTTASNKASIALPTPIAPTGLVASMYTVSGLSGYSVLNGSTVIQSATSSTGDFSVLRSQCASALNDCLVGYSKPFALFDTRNGVVIGVSMYATSSVTATTIPDIGIFTGGLGTPEGFADCLDDGLTGSIMCLGKNMVFWTIGLFVPNNQDLADIKETIYSTITSSSSLTSSIFLLPLQMSLWTASSSVPAYDNLTLSLPRVTGGYYTKEITGINTTTAQKRIDASLYSIFIWILGVFTVFFISKQFIKFIH